MAIHTTAGISTKRRIHIRKSRSVYTTQPPISSPRIAHRAVLEDHSSSNDIVIKATVHKSDDDQYRCSEDGSKTDGRLILPTPCERGSLIPPLGYSPWRDLLDELGKWNGEAPLAKHDPLSIGRG